MDMDEAVLKTIKKLGDIATYDGAYGGQEPLEMRVDAVRSLASYMPHPEATRILTDIIDTDYLNREIRQVAIQALRKK